MALKELLLRPRLIIAASVCQVAMLSSVYAQKIYTNVEVQWEIVLNEPDAISSSPSFSFIMSSRPDLSGDYAEIRLNAPVESGDTEIGVTIWSSTGDLVASSSRKVAPLTMANDVIKFTTNIRVLGSGTWYEIASVSSGSWGTIKDSDMPKAVAKYSKSVDFSIDLTKSESQVDSGKCRVKSVAITKVSTKHGSKWEIDDSLQVIFGDVVYPIRTKLLDEVVDSNTAYR